ncbi:MAG TPA: SRPBCC family protein [Burkholderiaceae bacterium]|nr:SRPBCC family protein [Burkholderiaceae bacterium]
MQTQDMEGYAPQGQTNLSRWMYAGAGTLLLVLGARSHSTLMRVALGVLGGGLLYKGTTGQDPVQRIKGIANQMTGQLTHDSRPMSVHRTLLIEQPASRVYTFWRKLSNLPRFMNHLEDVREIDTKRSHWVAKGPAGTRVEWDADIVNDVPNEELVWRSLPGADVENWGRVRFNPSADGRHTELEVRLHYVPPAGRLGSMVAGLFGEEPQIQVEEDLQRLKRLLERGEPAPGEHADVDLTQATSPQRNGQTTEAGAARGTDIPPQRGAIH